MVQHSSVQNLQGQTAAPLLKCSHTPKPPDLMIALMLLPGFLD